jgi:hypothetical protein
MPSQDDTLTLRPSIIGSWFLFCGLFMAFAIIFYERDPQGRLGIWYIMGGFFSYLIFYRLFQSYVFDDVSIHVYSFFGETGSVRYRDISDIEIRETFPSRISGTPHLLIFSKGQVLTLLSQKDAELLRERILKLRDTASEKKDLENSTLPSKN